MGFIVYCRTDLRLIFNTKSHARCSIVPPLTGRVPTAHFPGISCQATIIQSLRDGTMLARLPS
jgi:hypothetical protein